MADARGRAGEHDIARLEGHALRDIGDGLGDRKHHVIGVVGLHDLAVEPALDLQSLGAGRHFVGRDHPGAETSGAVKILAHVPLRGLALKFAHRAFVAAGIAGDARICVGRREVLCPFADDEDELGFVVERLRRFWAQDRLPVRNERTTPAHEDRREFRNVVALGAFLDMFEVVETEADHLARRRHRQTEGQAFQRTPRSRGSALCRVLERRQVALVAAQAFAEIAGNGAVNRLQVDHLVALDHAETQCAIGRETDDLHAYSLACSRRLVATSSRAGKGVALHDQAARARKWARSISRATRPASRSKAFTTARRKPPGGMAWRSGSLSS